MIYKKGSRFRYLTNMLSQSFEINKGDILVLVKDRNQSYGYLFDFFKESDPEVRVSLYMSDDILEYIEPRPHAELIRLWAGDKNSRVQHKEYGVWCDVNPPEWYPWIQYRIKPKETIKKWKWIVQCGDGYKVTEDYYSENEEIPSWVQRIEESMIEVEE